MTTHSTPLALTHPRTWRILFIVILLGGGAWMWVSRPAPGRDIAPAPRTGAPAPAFSTETVDGEAVRLGDYDGQVVVLNLWATWCPPCRAEMPDLEAVWQRYADDGMVVLAVNQNESASDVAAFRTEYDLTFPVALDRAGDVGRLYETSTFPTTYFIDRDGVIREVVHGAMPAAMIESLVRDLLED
ncbi:MAG: TlpA family protein disulfide reductase [Chloroflexi bacterium]|nr:TlpA family protein disulfide reductase [Chloroflexota bacterium]